MNKKDPCINLKSSGKYFKLAKLKELALYIVENHFKCPGMFKKNFKVDVNVVDDKKIRRINNQYLERDRVTDVIAFSLVEGQSTPLVEPVLLGQIIISSDTARRNALCYGHSKEKEMYLLFIHGMLHLLGWGEGKEIKEIQGKILSRFYRTK